MARFMKVANSNRPGCDHHINLDVIESIWLEESTVMIMFIGRRYESFFPMPTAKEAIDFYNKIITYQDT